MSQFLKKPCLVFCLTLFYFFQLYGQLPQEKTSDNIISAQLFVTGDQQSLPVYTLNSDIKLELEFDDLDGGIKNYYYTFVLCDYQWQPSRLSAFDYIKGFTQNRITTYRYSNIAFARYTHYQAFLPDRNIMPSRSGNYLLKVFLDGDTSKTVFTKPFMVLDPKVAVSAQVLQPFTPQLFNTHQRIKFTANVKELNSFSAPQQIKAVILQNNRWDIAQKDISPTFLRGNILEYNQEQIGVFPGGKEWRWLDLRSFRLQSDRVESGTYGPEKREFVLKKDIDKSGDRYVYFPDYNGAYNITTCESINPLWQGDYATIQFRLGKTDGNPYSREDVYLIGGFTGYMLNDKWKMNYDPESGEYRLNALMKQGYYNYAYVALGQTQDKLRRPLEGDYWETENSYTILLYYKSFTDRNDQLIGMSTINSRTDKPGFSF
ncbi:MAG: hypothetical protein RIR96_180 [Bacteroidota bacterium]